MNQCIQHLTVHCDGVEHTAPYSSLWWCRTFYLSTTVLFSRISETFFNCQLVNNCELLKLKLIENHSKILQTFDSAVYLQTWSDYVCQQTWSDYYVCHKRHRIMCVINVIGLLQPLFIQMPERMRSEQHCHLT